MSNVLPDVLVLDAEAVDANFQPVDSAELGTQSRVSSVELPGVPENTVLLKRMGVDRGLTRSEASVLQERLVPYRESLCAIGWRVPALYATRLATTGSEWQIWSYEYYVEGANMAQLVGENRPSVLARYAVRQVVDTLAKYPSDNGWRQVIDDQELTVLSHGIDLQPANIIVANDGAVRAVDIFGPKEVDTQGNPTTYNAKLENVSPHAIKVACATREGAMLRFLRKTQRLWTKSGLSQDEFIDDIDEILAMSDLPVSEAKLIVNEMDNDYPLLDKAYRPATV